MFKRYGLSITILLAIAVLQAAIAQNKVLPFKLVEGNNGKPLGKINAMSQDPTGYMWFASPGEKCIYRYDGNKIISYNHDDANPNSPGGIDPETICATSDGFIWIGFGDRGVDQYNPANGIFKHFVHDEKDSGSLSANTVTVILQDHHGRVWIGTDNGLDRYNEQTGKFIHYRHDPANPRSLSSNVVRCIYEDHQGTIWIGTGFPFFNTHPEDGGLNRLDTDGQFTSYKHDPKNPHSLINNKVSAVFEDSRGIFWVGTGGDGLHTMDRQTGVFERHLYDSTKPEQLSRPHRLKDDWHFTNEQVTFIIEDAVGAVWIGSMWGGINRYDTNTKKITTYDSSYGFPVHSSWSACNSRDGVLWITTEDDKLFRVYPWRKPVGVISENVTVSGLIEDYNRSLWVATLGKGLLQYDANKKLINHYQVSDSLNQSGLDSAFFIYSNGGDTIWVTSRTNAKIFNKKTGRITNFSLGYSFQVDNNFGTIFNIIQDASRNIWFGTIAGLFRYHPADGSVKRYVSDPKDSGSLSYNVVTHIDPDSAGEIWIGTFGGGMNRLNVQRGVFQHYLPGAQVAYTYKDHSGVFWIGTINGLYKYDRKNDVFTPFFDSQSALANERIFGIIEDDSTNLWLSTSVGIVRIDPMRDKKFIFDNKYGIDDLRYGSLAKTKTGELLFGYENGFYSFYPKELSGYEELKINITAFTINDKPVLAGNEGIFKKPVEDNGDLNLSYNQNNISFSFAAVDYRSPETIKYFTKLEGYDNEWRTVSEEQTANYFNVLPGSYVFRIRASNQDGVVNEKLLNIVIHPPWWKTWWAYTLYAFLFLTAVYVFVRQQKQRVIRNERHRAQAKELEQAKEIQTAYTELKATQAQLIHAEKMASMGEMTAGIAHEIQNPLNFVNNFSEINTELIEDLKSDLQNGKTNDALSVINNVLDNESKILYHGKRADAIVKSMLQHSRKSSGQKEQTDINKLVDEYIRLSYHGLRAKDKSFNAIINTDFDEHVGQVNIVPQEIGRVLLNLLNNAFYAVSEKAKNGTIDYNPIVEISTKKINRKVEIRIRDNGNGIPPQVIGKIFQPFFTTKATGEGTGLGLSLSFDIVTKGHGGELKVETEEGKYAEFIVCLPAD